MPTTVKPLPAEIARLVWAEATSSGVTVRAHDGIVTVHVEFTPGDKSAYVDAENACLRVLRIVPTVRAGSTWGTDSGSVGGAIGLQQGHCTLNKSGVGTRVVNEIAKSLNKVW